jgi:hypothetical protein
MTWHPAATEHPYTLRAILQDAVDDSGAELIGDWVTVGNPWTNSKLVYLARLTNGRYLFVQQGCAYPSVTAKELEIQFPTSGMLGREIQKMLLTFDGAPAEWADMWVTA